jgi:hypothetical protein
MAAHINKYFSPVTPVESGHVLMANGVSAICSMLGFLVGDPGDGVLLMRPIYGKFENDWGIEAGYDYFIVLKSTCLLSSTFNMEYFYMNCFLSMQRWIS